MVLPPNMSKNLVTYYEETGQTEKAEMQRQSNEHMNKIREQRGGEKTDGDTPNENPILDGENKK